MQYNSTSSNIFAPQNSHQNDRQLPNLFGNSQNNNNSSMNNSSMNNYNNQDTYRSQSAAPPYKMGSYREQFSPFKLDIVKSNSDEGPSYSGSLIQQKAYEKMTVMMLKIEDYYLIRTNQLDLQSHKKALDQAVQNQNFPKNLLQNNNQLKCPIFFPEKTRSNNYNSNNSNYGTSNSQNSQSTNYNSMGGLSNNNSFFSNNQQGNQGNNQLSNNSMNNPFTQNNTSSLFRQNNSSNNNNQTQQQSQTSNLFSSQNLFSNNNQQSVSMFQQPQQSIFSQQPNNMNQQSTNLFSQGTNMFSGMGSNNNMLQNRNSFNQPQYMQQQMPYNQMMMNQWGYNQQMMPMNPYYQQMMMMQQPRWDDQTLQTTIEFLQTELVKSQEIKEREQRQEEREYQLMILNVQEQQQRLEENEKKIHRQVLQRSRHSRSPSPNLRIVGSHYMKNSSRSPSPSISINKSSVHIGLNQSRVNNNKSSVHTRLTPNRQTESRILVRGNIQQESNTNIQKDIIKFSVKIMVEFLESEKVYPSDMTLEIYAQNTIFEFKTKILNTLKEKGALMPQTLIDKYLVASELYFGHILCVNECLVKQVAEFNNNEMNKFRFCLFQTVVPILTRQGYHTGPSIQELSRMTLEQLKNVQSFTIHNENGSITWLTPTDLTYLNLDEIIQLKEMEIECYDEDTIGVYFKPEQGRKLNKTCVATLKLSQSMLDNFAYPPESEFQYNHEQIYDLLKQKATEMQIELIDFDDKNLTYQVKIEHFSKYSFIVQSKEKTTIFEEKENDDQQDVERLSNKQTVFQQEERYQKKGEKFPVTYQDQQSDDYMVQEQDEEIEQDEPAQDNQVELNNIRNEVQTQIQYAQSEQIGQVLRQIEFKTQIQLRVMKFNQRMFQENKGDPQIYSTIQCGGQFNQRSNLYIYDALSGQISVKQINSSKPDGGGRFIVQILDAVAAAEQFDKNQCPENLIFQLMIQFINSQWVDSQNSQIQAGVLKNSQDLCYLVNILFGNPTLNLQTHMAQIDQDGFEKVLDQLRSRQGAPLLNDVALDSLRRSCLKQWLMNYYWQSLSKSEKHQDFRGYQRYHLYQIQNRFQQAVLVTSQTMRPEIIHNAQLFESSSDETWLPKILSILEVEQDLDSFWERLLTFLQPEGCHFLTQAFIILRLYINEGGQDQTLFMKCVDFMEKEQSPYKLILFYLLCIYCSRLEQSENLLMLRRILKNLLTSLGCEDTENFTLLRIASYFSKYLYENTHQCELFIQQCYSLYPSPISQSIIEERIIVRPKIVQMVRKNKLMEAITLAHNFNLHSYVIHIATQQLIPNLINQFLQENHQNQNVISNQLISVAEKLGQNKKCLPQFQKNSGSIVRKWWNKQGKIYTQAAKIIPNLNFYDEQFLSIFFNKMVNYKPDNLQQYTFKLKVLESLQGFRDIAIVQ